MYVKLESAEITRVDNVGIFYVRNEEGYFKVQWCEKTKHYKIEKLR